MKTKFTLLMPFVLLLNCALAQSITATFTAVNNQEYLQLDSIKIINRTQACEALIIYPDTVYLLTVDDLAGEESIIDAFKVGQNYPNPVIDKSNIEVFIPEDDQVRFIITDQVGRIVHASEDELRGGKHTFIFTPGASSIYIFSAIYRDQPRSIKIINANTHKYASCELKYYGFEYFPPLTKSLEKNTNWCFNIGDTLLYVGYSGGLESGHLDAPVESTTYTLQFATNIPCLGTPTVMYGGQEYNTIQIFNQCWLKENLNIGVMIDETQSQSNNGIIEKYCLSNDEDSCAKYGGLYLWNEMMEYINIAGTQGLCPDGWHITTDEEWMILEGAVDSQYGIGDIVWDGIGNRGFDAGINLRTTTGWYNNGNGNDLFGFSLIPAGYFGYNFSMVGKFGFLWTSTRKLSTEEPVHRSANFALNTMFRANNYGAGNGMSVRCIKDN